MCEEGLSIVFEQLIAIFRSFPHFGGKDLLISFWLLLFFLFLFLFFFFRHFFDMSWPQHFATYQNDSWYMISQEQKLLNFDNIKTEPFSLMELSPRALKILWPLLLRNRKRYRNKVGTKLFVGSMRNFVTFRSKGSDDYL